MKTNPKEMGAPTDPQFATTREGGFSANSLSVVRTRLLSLEWIEGQSFVLAIARRITRKESFHLYS
jgi:hypothetical protein